MRAPVRIKESGVVPEVSDFKPSALRHPDPERFYRIRRRISTGLLLFVVVVGLPIVGIPALRQRLSTRILALKSAMAGSIKPATLVVGANHEPLPPEYRASAPPAPSLPVFPQLKNKVYSMDSPVPGTPSSPPVKLRYSARAGKIEVLPSPAEKEAEPAEQADAQPVPSTEPELKYQKGKAEQDAYNLLLQSNATVAAMVQGSNPSLKFKSWDAANRGEDTYWVRLKFQSAGDQDEDYIWVVKLQSNEVTPLSHNARSIS
jgi:hypothetical protein